MPGALAEIGTPHRSTSNQCRTYICKYVVILYTPPFLDSFSLPSACQNNHSSQKQRGEQQRVRQKYSQGETQALTSLHNQPEAKRHRSSTPITVRFLHTCPFSLTDSICSQSLFTCLHPQSGATAQATSMGSPAFLVHPALLTTPDVV